MSDIVIRGEAPADYAAVENLVRESFWNVYRPGCLEHFVLHRLRDAPEFVRELDFVMEKGGRIIGQNVFVMAEIALDGGGVLPVLAMGPICIDRTLQRKGLGKKLLDYSLDRATELGFGAVCFEGNIDFYGKSGFGVASKKGVRYHGLPEGADASFFLCKELRHGYLAGVRGDYAPPRPYFVADENPAEFEAFEATFPPKEKLVLPGQIFVGQ
jgi:predicted N-acetyltransferase YhbS